MATPSPTSRPSHSSVARKALAFAKWQYPYTLTPEQRAEKARLDRDEELEHPLPEGSNRELHDVFFAALREKKAKWMDESKDYCTSEFHMIEFCVYICSMFKHLVRIHRTRASKTPSKSKVPLPIGNVVGRFMYSLSSLLIQVF